MRRFPLVSGPGSAGSFNQSIAMPPRVICPPTVPCSVAALWVPIETIAGVSVSSGFDPPDYGSVYAGGLFTAQHSTNTFGQWEIDTTGIPAPLVCAVQIESGALLNNISFLIGNSTYLWIDPGPDLQPYFLLSANTPTQLLQFYESTDPSAGNLATPVTFRVLALQLSLP